MTEERLDQAGKGLERSRASRFERGHDNGGHGNEGSAMTNTAAHIKLSLERIERLDQAIKAQRRFLQTIPDPDTRYRAEGNLMEMVMTVEALRDLHEKLLEG